MVIRGGLVVFTAYCIGSITFGLVISKLWKSRDPRLEGSGNVGATNVYRVLGKAGGMLTLLSDGGKGFLVVYGGGWYGMSSGLFPSSHGHVLEALVLIAVILGHIFPIWFRWKGGKGVATSAGACLALSVPLALLCAGIWLFVFLAFRYVSLASLVAGLCAPVSALFFLEERLYAYALFFLLLLVIFTHRQNIRRLWRGEEASFRGGGVL
ncbi:MAG: glycerol-3-phosphate 1-O-acyltransferase PlsY [Alphaproteobacteria bacterium GM7ARS4]|nr:glycerol-3-phosphate 1-O-acyltransferase PlsY [Alphaproteobacteria bacterium GM7ARS4]